jgi:DNA-binding NarL/FixJ family response regulator
LVFSVHADLSLAEAALREGARGFVHAGMSPQQIVRALEVAAQSELAAPRKLLEYLISNEVPADLDSLTSRQRDILDIVAEGLSNAEIGERLFLSESTIKQHLRAAYKELGVRSRYEATKLLRTARTREEAPVLMFSPA